MENLSFTQEYFLCAVNKKGDLPFVSSSEAAACLVAGGIMELTNQKFITRGEKNKIELDKPWDNSLPYLAPIYDKINSSEKFQKVDALLSDFALGVKNKSLNGLVDSFREALIKKGCLDIVEGQGLTGNKTKYIPKPEVVTEIIGKVRAEFLEDGDIEEDVLCLAVLLLEGRLIKNYFSKVEVKKMKARIKEVRESDAYASVKDIFNYMDAVAIIIITVAT